MSRHIGRLPACCVTPSSLARSKLVDVYPPRPPGVHRRPDGRPVGEGVHTAPAAVDSRRRTPGRPNPPQSGPRCLSGPHSRAGTAPIPERTRGPSARHGVRGPGRRGHDPGLHRPALGRTRRPPGQGHRPDFSSALCPRAAPEVVGHIVIGPPKSRAGIRTVPLPKVVVAIFRGASPAGNPTSLPPPHPMARCCAPTTSVATPAGTKP